MLFILITSTVYVHFYKHALVVKEGSFSCVLSVPSYVTARGPRAIAAYQRAKATGKTLDRRVKVLLIGQDRVGKTSVGRSLKGEPFRANEASTDGVQMHGPLKNPGERPWKFCTMQGETTAYHHKCAEYIGRELLAETKAEETMAYKFPRPTKRPRPTDRLSLDSLDFKVNLPGLKRVFQVVLNYSLFFCLFLLLLWNWYPLNVDITMSYCNGAALTTIDSFGL